MDMFKKIYNALIVIFILSLLYIGLIALGVIDISYTDKTSIYMLAIAVDILIMTFLFSRAANVIANRNARVVGYIATFVGLINLLLTALQLILEDASALYEISNVMSHITIFSFLIVMVYEIPQSNTAHGKFQNMTALIIAITAIFPYITGLKDFDSGSSLSGLTSLSSYNTNQFGLDKSNTDNVETLEKINTFLTFLSIGTFLINPMLRVHYIDKDYVALHEVDDVYSTATKYQANTQPDPYKNLSDKYKKDVMTQQPMTAPIPVPVPMQNPLPPPTISEITPSVVEDMPMEKVVNQQFKPEEIPEAIIPTIGGIPETETVAQIPAVNNEAITELTQTPEVNTEPVVETNTVEVAPQTPVSPNPLEIATQTQEPNPFEIATQTPVQQQAEPNSLEIATQTPVAEAQVEIVQPTPVDTTPTPIVDTTPTQEVVQPQEDNLLNIVKPTE